MRVNKDLLGKLQTYFTGKLGMYKYRRGWLKGTCPFCGRVDKFGVNLSAGKTNCFVCGYYSRPIEVIKTLENFETNSEVLSFIGALEYSAYYDYVPETTEYSQLNLPPGFNLLNQGDSEVAHIVQKYMRRRGFNIDDLSFKGFGYCDTGKYFGHVIIPYYREGQLIYFNARKVIGDGPKFNNPLKEEMGLGKSLVIYNIDALALYEKIYLVESALNAETLGDNAIATSGKNISSNQFSNIIRISHLKKLIIILDPDAINEAIKLGLRLVYYKKLKLIQLPEKEDVNSLGRKKTLEFVRKEKYLTYSSLLKMKLDYERSFNTY